MPARHLTKSDIKLFDLLIDKGICPTTARFLIMLYSNLYVHVKWGDNISSSFGVTNGVKQGGVLSPILFGVYLDKLLYIFRMKGVGCHIGHVFFGALAYADDIIILALTRHALN